MGIISGALSAADIAARLKSMAERIRHRGPDADGFFVSNPITVITNDASSGGTGASGGGTDGSGTAAA